MKVELLCELAMQGMAAELHWVLEHAGADPDGRDAVGISALSHASERGHAECAALLIKHGADINTQDRGATPLIIACMEGHESVVHQLLAFKASTE